VNYPRVNVVDLTSGRRNAWYRRGLVLGTIVLFIVCALFITSAAEPAGAAASAAARAAAGLPPGSAARIIGDGRDSYAEIVDAVTPAVVTIRSERRTRAPQQFPFMQDPFFRDFFGDRMAPPAMPEERREGGLGSGVIVSADGSILTNHHVVDGAEEITVELQDRRSFKATVVGSDAASDLAVLKIDGRNLPALTLGDSDRVRVGDVVLAVGNPMGVGQTVTMGIVSAKGRATGLGDGSFEDFLQTDAPINRGNSGGALVNTRGELIGINAQILSPSGGNIGIGFAIPANMARQVMHALMTDGRVHRGMLGVTVQPVTPEIANSLRMDAIRGALVNGVQEDGPADAAGVKRGDVIVALNGAEVESSNDLRNEVAALKPGTKAELTVVRGGREHTITATLGELPTRSEETTTAQGETTGSVGLAVEPLPAERARQLDIEGGLLVTAVNGGSDAADAGFRRGDVIEQVDGRRVARAADLREALARGERPALVLVRRGDASLFLTLPRTT
jgi:Do/DeqQ family serine protease